MKAAGITHFGMRRPNITLTKQDDFLSRRTVRLKHSRLLVGIGEQSFRGDLVVGVGFEFDYPLLPNAIISFFLSHTPYVSHFHTSNYPNFIRCVIPKWEKIREKHATNTPPRTRYSHHQPQSNRLGGSFAKTFDINFSIIPIPWEIPNPKSYNNFQDCKTEYWNKIIRRLIQVLDFAFILSSNIVRACNSSILFVHLELSITHFLIMLTG